MINQKSRFLKSDISLDQYGSVVFNLKDLANALGSDKTYLKDITIRCNAWRAGTSIIWYE